jgi:hypothetical protein
MKAGVSQQDVRRAVEPNYAQQHGCAWFLWPSGGARSPHSAGGIASIGGQAAFRFRHWKELSSDITWWTNLTQTEAWSLGQWSRLRESAFLGADWLGLIGEWGFPADDQGLMDGCAAWSETLARIGGRLATFEAAAGRLWVWSEGSLAENLGTLWSLNDPPSPPDPRGRVLRAAYVEKIESILSSHEYAGLRKMSLSFPRLAHAQSLWLQRYPASPFEIVPEEQLPRDSLARRRWISDQVDPVLVQVDDVVSMPGHEADRELFWGRRARRLASSWMEPAWLTGEEVQVAMGFCEFTVQSVFRSRGWTQASPPPGWPGSAPLENPLDGCSVTLGLLAKAGWEAHATPARAPGSRARPDPSPRAVWWRSADRQRCLLAARTLERSGVRVLSYGRGEVQVAIDSARPAAEVARAVREAGLVLPAALATAIPVEFSAGTNDTQAISHWLRAHGSAETLLQIDRLVAPWKSPGGQQEVRSVLERAAKGLLQLDPAAPEDWKRWWGEALRTAAQRAVTQLKRQ